MAAAVKYKLSKMLHVIFMCLLLGQTFGRMGRANAAGTYIVSTPASEFGGRDFFKLIKTNSTVPFSVQACHDAVISISDGTTYVYEVVLGASENNRVELRSLVNENDVIIKDAPNVLDCDSKKAFWIYQKGQSIQVGEGHPTQGVLLLDHQFATGMTMHTMGISTRGVSGVWYIEQKEGNRVQVKSDTGYSYGSYWMTVTDRNHIAFKIQACSESHLALSSALSTSEAYEIIIGGWGNQRSGIRKELQGELFDWPETQGIVDCNEMREFWMSWHSGLIRVGQGTVVGVGEFMHWQDPEYFGIYAVSLTTCCGVEGLWEFRDADALPEPNMYVLNTPGDNQHTKMWLTTINHYVTFEFQGCTDLKMALASNPMVTTDSVYEVLIGGWTNMQSAFRRGLLGTELIRKDTPSILSCTESRPFWVGWENGKLSAGTGDVYGENTFMEYQDPQPYPVVGVSLSSGWNDVGNGTYRVRQDQAQLAFFKTPPYNGFNTMWLRQTQKQHIMFGVKTCNDADIAMGREFHLVVVESYEVLFGGWGNTRSAIRRQGSEVAAVDTPGILSCNETRFFWFSWYGGVIEMGRGLQVGQRRILAWADPEPQVVETVGFSGWDTEPDWEFSHTDAQLAFFKTPPTGGYDTMWLRQTQKQHVMFGVKTCNDANIALGTELRLVEVESYEVVIGGWGNTRSAIRRQGSEVAAVDTPGIVSCNETRFFWVSWYGGVIEMGRGLQVGQRRFLAWADPEPRVVEIVGFSGWDTENDWEFSHTDENDMILTTGPSNTSPKNGTWLDITDRTAFQFKLKACSHAQIELRTGPNDDQSKLPPYRIIIGMPASSDIPPVFNQLEIMYLSSDGQPVTHLFTIDKLLSCEDFSQFWLSWLNGNILIGRNELFKNPIASVGDPIVGRRFSALYLSSADSAVTQEWEYSLNSVQRTTLATQSTGSTFKSNWLSLRGQRDIIFSVRACSDAQILLATYTKVDTISNYRVTIGAQSNSVTMIGKDDIQKGVMATTANVLHCNYTRSFWLSWRGNFVELGTGTVVGDFAFLTLVDLSPYLIRAISFDSPAHSSATWQLGRTEVGDTHYVYTPASYFGERDFFKIVTMKNTFSFTITACHDAVISISNGTTYVYEVVLGASQNSRVELRSLVNDNDDVVFTNTPNVLNCDSSRSFWIYHTGERIQVGSGALLEVVILDSLLSTPMIMRALGVSTRGVDGAWIIGKREGKLAQIKSPPNYNYNSYWVTVDERRHLAFKVQACNDAHIALSSSFLVDTENTYEIVIGGWDNTRSGIRNESQGFLWVWPETPGILDCNEMRDFWITWESGLMRVGQGAVVGIGEFMHWQDPEPFEVHSVSITTCCNVAGLWEFSEVDAETFILETFSQLDYSAAKVTVWDPSYFEFRLRTCREAYVSMFTNFHAYEMYQVSFATDSVSLYSIAAAAYVQVVTYPDLVSCTDDRPFWIGWKRDGVIEVGRGRYGQSRLLEYEDTVPTPINSLSLNCDTESATWEFSRRQVGTVECLRNLGDFWIGSMALTVAGQDSLQFDLNTGGQVSFYIAQMPGIVEANIYEIRLGTGIYKDGVEIYSENVLQASKYVGCVMDNDSLKQYWISWKNGLIRVGVGAVVGATTYLSWQDPKPHPVNTVHFYSGVYEYMHWRFSANRGDRYMLTTLVGQPHLQIWMMLHRQLTSLSVDIAGCSDVSILLAGEAALATRSAYEIILGAFQNSEIIINKAIEGKMVPVRQAYVLGLVHCEQFRTFWVSWQDGTFQAGVGVVGQQPVIIYTDTEDYKPIQALSIASNAENTRFNILRYQVLGMHFNTSNDRSLTRSWMTYTAHHHVVFLTRTCYGAVVILSQQAYNTSAGVSYEIEFQETQNSYSFIRDGLKGLTLANAYTPNLLHCDQERAFWVSWFGLSVSAGAGAHVGQNILLQHNVTSQPVVDAIALGTDSDGYVRLIDSLGNAYRIISRDDDNDFQKIYLKPTMEYIPFRVRACQGARILLDGSGYFIELGANQNMQIAIARVTDQVAVKVMSAPNMISCTYERLFWISWINGTIEVGSGRLFEDTLISYKDASFNLRVSRISVTTGLGYEGEWEFSHDYVDEINFVTPNEWTRKYAWVSTQGVDYVTFDVASCTDAHISLSTIPTYTEVFSYMVIIGGWSNTQSAIRDEITTSVPPKVQVSTPQILHCNEPRSFWVSWSNHKIQAGRGSVPYEYAFMEWQDNGVTKEVTNVGLSTGNSASGVWSVRTIDQMVPPTDGPVTASTPIAPTPPPSESSEDNVYMVYTTNQYAFDHVTILTEQKSFVFSQTACTDLSIFLSHLPGVLNNEAYQITLGTTENTRSTIDKTEPRRDSQLYTTPGILGCNPIGQWMWVSWSGGTIEVGHGSVIGQSRVFTWTDPSPYEIHALYIASRGSELVTWTFLRESGRVLTANTISEDYHYQQLWFTTRSTDSTVLRIRACADAHVLLSEFVGSGENSYEVAFGINGNKESVIRESEYGTNVVWIDTPQILSCTDFRYFWFRWKDERLQVGTGSVVGRNMIMEHAKENHPENILSVGISTGWDSSGTWEISNLQGPTYTVNSWSYLPNMAWFYPVGMSIEFYFQGCTAAEILLARNTYDANSQGFKITLGAQSTITDLQGNNEYLTINTPNLLSCYSLRKYWISWIDVIRIGHGRLNYNQVAEYRHSSSIPISAIALQNKIMKTDGEWQISRKSVNSAIFHTFSDKFVGYLHAWHSVPEQKYVSFKVKACGDARILLARYFGVIDSNVYEVWLGKTSNMVSVITSGIGGTVLATQNTNRLLDCNHARWFWIDWSKGITVGSGAFVGDQQFLSVSSVDISFEINAISVDTAPFENGDWEFTNVPVRQMTVNTPAENTRGNAWIVVDQEVFVFKVQACTDARLVLSEDPFDMSSFTREIIIGGKSNTVSGVYGQGNSALKEVSSPKVLDCAEILDFWIRWKYSGGTFTVGKGPVDTGVFIEYVDPDPRPIHAVSVSTDVNSVGQWQWKYESARLYRFFTQAAQKDYSKYQYQISDITWIAFKLQACNDGHIGLFDSYMMQSMYEVVLGGYTNTRSSIRREQQGDDDISVASVGILNCDEMRPFWISWVMGNIKVGRGNLLDEGLIMQFQYTEPTSVSVMSISTGWNAAGTWEFDNFEDNMFLVRTPDDASSGNHWLQFGAKQQFIAFQVRACTNARLILSQMPSSTPLYAIVLGHESNTRSKIIRYEQSDSSEEILAEAETLGVIDCYEWKGFWLSFGNKKIELKSWSADGPTLLDFYDDQFKSVFAMSLSTGPDAVGNWKYSYHSVSNVAHITEAYDEERTYGDLIYTLTDRAHVVFVVQACNDASIALSEIPGVFTHATYELVIGASSNTLTLLRESVRGMTVQQVETPGILECQSPQIFWISWNQGAISFGKGQVVEQNRIIYYKGSIRQINSLSVMTALTVKGVWTFPSFSGNVYELHTPDDGNAQRYDYNLITTYDDVVSFAVKACNDAHILLQTVPGSVTDRCYEIVLGGYKNTRSDIRDGIGGSKVLNFYLEDNMMKCDQYLQFWINWRNGTIEVGKNLPYTQKFMSYEFPPDQVPPITAFTMTTAFGSDGDWILFERDVSSMRLMTIPTLTYTQMAKSTLNQHWVIFQVMACRDAHVALTEQFNNRQTRTYEIIIGGNENRNSFIRDIETYNEVQRVDTPDIMDCYNFKTFWVTWGYNYRIAVGEGAVVDSRTFLDFNDFDQRNFAGFMISTYTDITGIWDFSFIHGNRYTIFTQNEYRYNYTWIQPTGNYLTFSVRTCNDAHILLSTGLLDSSADNSYEIVFGAFDNTRTVIRKGSHGTELTNADTPDIMNCDEFLPLWVQWENKLITIGSGPLNSHVIAQFTDNQLGDNLIATVSSWIDSPAEFHFLETQVMSAKVFTSASQQYRTLHRSLLDAQYTTFKVKAASDVMISLLRIPRNILAASYEFIIGAQSNQVTILRVKAAVNGQDLEMHFDTPDVLSSVDLRAFWVGWINGTIQIGRGEIFGQGRLMNYPDPQPTYRKYVHSLAIASGTDAEWEFGQTFGSTMPTTESVSPSSQPTVPTIPDDDLPDDSVFLYTTASLMDDHVVITTERTTLVFSTDGCKDLNIYLSHIPGNLATEGYQISVGINDNTKSGIRTLPPNSILYQEFDTNGILKCTDMATYWISWMNSRISFGAGSVVGSDQKFEITDVAMYSINAFSLASKDTKAVKWNFLKDYGRTFSVTTVEFYDYTYQQFWFTTASVDHAVLRVKTCHDAHIVLSEDIGLGNNVYEVALGIIGNTATVIREGLQGVNIVKVDTPNIVSCDEFRYFWLRWKDQRLELGTGSVVGVNMIAEHSKPNHPEKIRSIGTSTGWEAAGRWEVSNIEGQAYTIYTPVTPADDGRSWFYVVGKFLVFRVRSCNDAKIRLASTPMQDETWGYDVTLTNTVSTIVKVHEHETAETFNNTAGLLDCTALRTFWVTWTDGVRVGAGRINTAQFLHLTDSSIEITAVAISASPNYVTEWQISKDIVTISVLTTPPAYEYKYVWHTVVDQSSITFKVKACSDVYILLAGYFGVTDTSVYEILLGGNGNNDISIRNGVGGSPLLSRSISGLLHCTKSNWFWIDWSTGIRVGLGAVAGGSELLAVSNQDLPVVFPINAISMATGPQSQGALWEYSAVPIEQVVIFSEGFYDQSLTSLILQNNYIIFQLQSCSDAHILLAEDPFATVGHKHEVVLGAFNNTKSLIYDDVTTGTIGAEVSTPNILSCDNLRSFWIQWKPDGTIAVGTNALNTGEIMSFKEATAHQIRSVAVSTGSGELGQWWFQRRAARVYRVKTSTAYDYRLYSYFVAPSQTSMTFKVQACNDAHVGLFDKFATAEAYEIVLGGYQNQRSAIRSVRQQANEVEAPTPSILNCNEMRPFWVSWAFGTIRVGRGNLIDEDLIMQWKDPDPMAINIVAISTGWEATGLWEFTNLEAKSLTTTTAADPTKTKHWIGTTGVSNSLQIDIIACQNARITFTQLPFLAPRYEIIIGQQNGTVSQISRYTGSSSAVVATENTPGVLDCVGMRSFYLSWSSGTIQVKKGSSEGPILIDWKDDEPYEIYGISLTTGPDSTGTWSYIYDSGSVQEVIQQTGDSDDSYESMIRSLTGVNEIIFGVMACRDAQVLLMQIPGVFSHMSYELVIGTTSNTQTYLKDGPNGAILAQANTPNILNCTTMQIFWLIWKDGELSFGKGSVAGQGEVFRYIDANRYGINALSVLTPPGVAGVWVFSGLAVVEVYELHTPDDGENYQYMYNILTVNDITLTFVVRACNDAHILLQSVPGSMTDECFEIVIGGWSNTRSVIRDGKQGNELVVNTDPAPLNCAEYRMFWISWRNNAIEVGKNHPYTQGFLLYKPESSITMPINALTFTSGFQSDADWFVLENHVSSLQVTTLPEYKYNQMSKSIASATWLVFRVLTCSDAHVLLSELYNNIDTRAYEIIIGESGNTRSLIRDHETGKEAQNNPTPNILDCKNYKTFWISWGADYRIAVGQGSTVNSGKFLDWLDSEQRVFKGVTVSTPTQTGYWDFAYTEGNVFSVYTAADYRYDYVWFAPRYNYLTFKVRTCNDAHVMLATYPMDFQNKSYEIVLGAYDNTKSDIRLGSHGEIVEQADTPNICNCDLFLQFWVRWGNHILDVGSGKLDSHVLMHLEDPNMHDIQALSLTSWETAVGEYELLESEVRSMRIYTWPALQYRTIHRSLLENQEITFRVKIAYEATVALLTVPGSTAAPCYILDIGAQQNSKIILRVRSPTDEQIIKDVDAVGIVNPNEFKPFWLSWYDQTVRFGTGHVVGVNILLEYVDPVPLYRTNIHSIAVSSINSGTMGQWEFGEDFDVPATTSTSVTVPTSTTPSTHTSTTSHTTTTTTTATTHTTTTTTTTHSTTTSGTTSHSASTTTTGTIAGPIQTTRAPTGLTTGGVVGITFSCMIAFMIISLVILYRRTKRQQQLQGSTQENVPIGIQGSGAFDNPAYAGYSGNSLELKTRKAAEEP